VQLPIQTYGVQSLPIVLASDHEERFYYVTTHNYRSTWDMTTRTITMHNIAAESKPFVTFHYVGAPSYISFNCTNGIKGNWIIEESVDGINWTVNSSEIETNEEKTYIKKLIQLSPGYNPTYIRVKYNSLYSEKVDITNLMIIGEQGAFITPSPLTVNYVSESDKSTPFTVTAINLLEGMRISTDNPYFTLTHGANDASTASQEFILTNEQYPNVFIETGMESLGFKVYFNADAAGAKAVDYTTLTIQTTDAAKVLATVKVTGIRKHLTNGTLNICTGVPDGTDGENNVVEGATVYTLNGSFDESAKEYRKMNIDAAFDDGQASFDYLFIFGETTTMDGTTTISTPTTLSGSNAKTPCYIYEKKDGAYESYAIIENANASTKVLQDFLRLTNPGAEEIRVYITGFCPYASTGYTKQDEGVFFFQGGPDDNIHVYLENCYLYSRSKTDDGHYFENRSDGQSFTEGYVKGSGGVLVFECTSKSNNGHPLNVTIHTRGNNIFKSHYGCFLESVAGRAFQVSSPVQIHMQTDEHITASYTTLNFTDEWTGAERTNGFLSLQKQVNNAPSIDLGNANTVVNFNGGQIELQNAQNVSDNYESTLAISHRLGTFAGFRLAYGLGSDGVGGTVNFKDGTTTVLRMEVSERYRQYYLMDEDDPATPEDESKYTSCLRCPQNTYVYGGSHCMMRA
jgi:hypothetical protein